MDTLPTSIGSLLRDWRQRRRYSQLHLALEAGISQRHLSFVESGRALPSRDMILTLSDGLSIPLRERNRLLLAAGYAPRFGERTMDHPGLKPAMEAVAMVLKGHEPNPALAVDRHWNMVAANSAITPFMEGVADPALLEPPVNVLRLSLHPKGLAPRILNLGEWHQHVIERLKGLNDAVADPALAALEEELSNYPSSAAGRRTGHTQDEPIAVPLRIRAGGAVLSFITTTTVFGTPLDVTLSELAIESFFPTDAETAAYLKEAPERPETAA